MDEYIDLPNMPDYVSIKEAAEILGLSANRVYEYVTEGRLSGVRAADVIMIPVEEVRNFKRGTTGRPRKNNPKWRLSPQNDTLFTTLITVQIRRGQRDRLLQKLEEIRREQQHLLPGTTARYIIDSETHPGRLVIVLIWRSTLTPDEPTHKEALEAFQQTFADVLDWSTAQYDQGMVLLHT